MKSSIRFAMVLGLVLVSAGGAHAQQSLLTQTDLDALGYFKYWSMSLEMGRARAINGAYLLDDALYITTDSGDVHAIHAAAGLTRWAQNVAESAYPIYAPTHCQAPDGRGLVIVSTAPRTLVIDRYLGDIVADMPLEMATSSSAVASDDRLYFGSSDGHFYAMRWTDPRTNRAVQIWRVIAGGPVTSAPVLVNNDDDLIFASQSGAIYNCTTVGKMLNWQARTGGPVIADVAVDGPGVFVASADRSLYRFNLIGGGEEWRVRFPEPLTDSPVVAGGIVFQYCPGEGITALDAQSGETLWRLPEARKFVCRGVDYAILTDAGNSLLRVDVNKGDVRARVRLAFPATAVRNVRDNALYLASNTGSLFCARPAGTPHLSPAELSAARRAVRTPQSGPGAPEADAPLGRRPPEQGPVDPEDPLRSPSDAPANPASPER